MCDCLNPTPAWRIGTIVAKDGVVSPRYTFSHWEAFQYYSRICLTPNLVDKALENNGVNLPCGKCVNCMREKRRDWSVRLVHEASMHDKCCMITLTYNDDNLPITDDVKFDRDLVKSGDKRFWRGADGLSGTNTLCVRDVQLWLKRLRRRLEYMGLPSQFRYFVCGEYGSKTHRPHYHIVIFGWSPSDKVFFFRRGSHDIFRSALLEQTWKLGFSTVTDVSAALAKYCARYVTKKMVGMAPPDCVVPEFILQSTRCGGIGSTWLDRFKLNLRSGLLTYRCGDRIIKCSTPKYYMRYLRKHDLPLWLELRDQRIEWIVRNPDKVGYHSFGDIMRKAEHFMLQVNYEREKEKIDETQVAT